MIIDTNALSAWRDGDERLIRLLYRQRLMLPVIVVGEYLYGLQGSRYQSETEGWLHGLIGSGGVEVIPVELDCSEIYATLRSQLRSMGKPIPDNDQWIAALASLHGVPVLSRDSHFDHVSSVRRISW